MQKYTIWAHNHKLNQTMHQVNLDDMPADATHAQAQQRADAFAMRLNQQQHMMSTDWAGVVKLEEVGVETLPGYLFHDPLR